MNESYSHPAAERLQAYIERDLEVGEGAVVESHLATCPRCRSEVEELRTLFEMLSQLPALTPSGGFADRVMARVRVRRPWFALVNEWLERMAPQTTRGWAAATAVVALPMIAAASLIWWITSQPGVTAQGLLLVGTGLASDAALTGWQWMVGHLAGSTPAVWLAAAAELLGGVGRGELGLAVVAFGTLTAASVWILYQNLIRPEVRRSDYASYVF